MISIANKVIRPKCRNWILDGLCSSFHFSSLRFSNKIIRIGCASGFWGDSPSASLQLVKYGRLDFIIYDYLSEITMSLLTASRAKKPEMGYAPDFISHAIGPNLLDIKNKGIKVISNAGGINPIGCAKALQQLSEKAGVNLKIAVVLGDNLMQSKENYIGTPDMKSRQPLPNTVHSMNCYLGSEPIVKCLDLGADIVITGRCADSSLALAPMIHSFGWKWTDFDLLASGSLAGHLIECGAQVTGGIFTDWEKVEGWENIGYPIAEVSESGTVKITKAPNTGGVISKGTASEQLLYEIGDPRAYVLPDVVCDFTQVSFKEVADGVEVFGAIGKSPTDSLKVCATYLDGFKCTSVCCVGGRKSVAKARKVAEAIIKRSRNIFKLLGLKDFTRVHIQELGSEETYGANASIGEGPRESVLWMSVHHQEKRALDIFSMEVASAGTSMAPGLTSIVGGRPKPSPLLRLHSFLVKKEVINPVIHLDDLEVALSSEPRVCVSSSKYEFPDQIINEVPRNLKRGHQRYPLSSLAYARSGDKGDSCNIGVIARKEEYFPYIEEALSKEVVATYFAHLFPEGVDPNNCIKIYKLEGVHGINIVLEESLGGGGIASLRSDPQGKAFAQMLLDLQIQNMPNVDTL